MCKTQGNVTPSGQIPLILQDPCTVLPKMQGRDGSHVRSPAKRALEAPFPVRRARVLHFEQTGGEDAVRRPDERYVALSEVP